MTVEPKIVHKYRWKGSAMITPCGLTVGPPASDDTAWEWWRVTCSECLNSQREAGR